MFTRYLTITRALALAAIAAAIVLFLNTSAVAVSYPFCDDMEDTTTGNWLFDSPWGYDGHYAHSGSLSISDSPGGNYYENNTNISATLSSMDLSTADMPVLTFWHRCALETNADYGYVDVSTDGGSSWGKIYFVTGFSTEWREEKVDLSQYTLHSDVRIRFRLQSNSQNRYDGWYIDDVCIQETSNPVIAYPFFDDMEDTAVTDANWLSSSWGLVGDAHSGVCSWHNSPEGGSVSGVHSSFTLAGTVDLYGATNPQMTFWHHYNAGSRYVEVSENYGHTWTSLASNPSPGADWTQYQVDLSDYVGLEIRVRFRYQGGGDGWYIDDVRIKDAPPDVELKPLTNMTMHGADLTWTKYTGSGFERYEVYRNTCPGVNRFDDLVASFSDIDDTTYSDTCCILEPNYYCYKVFVVDTTGMYSRGSNTEQATYTIPTVSYPFCDSMENGTDNWEWGSPWGLTTEYAHSGSFSWTDSPEGYYQNDANTAFETSIDLTTADMPVLTFWHRCALETNKDWGFIDVSTNGGSSWKEIYFLYGFDTEWREEKVDLSEYALHSDVRIRFRLKTDNQNRYDGWYIDDVCIQETSNPVISYPFFDDMEDTAVTDANWLSSSWDMVDDAHSGVCSWHDSPEGYSALRVSASLTLAGTIDLAGATNPQLTFWHRYDIGGPSYVEVSEDYGHSWTSHASFGGTQAGWTQYQVDLSDYVGLEIRVRFRLYQNSTGNDGWYVDDVRISEAIETMVDWCNLDSPDSISTSVGIETDSIFGLVYESGITDDPGQGSGIGAQLGYGPDGTLPSTGSWTWVEANYHSDVDSMDRYAATLILPYGGTFDYAYRYRLMAEQVWCYGDLDGNDLGIEGFNGYSTSQAGHLEVAGEAGIYVLPAEFDIPLNVGEVLEDTLIIRNDGTGALTFEILEAVGGGLSAEAAPSSGDIKASALIKPFSVQTEDLPPNQKSALSGGKTEPGNPSSRLTMVDVPWVTENPSSGTVPPNDSSVVVVTFDASETGSGAYDAYLVIMNNDPDSDMVVVELHLSVNPPGPFSLLSPPNGDSLAVPGLLHWQTAADPDPDDTVRYDIWLSTEVGFRDSVVKVEGITDSSVLLEDVTADTMWYWKVLASDQSGAERWSNESWNFYTGTRGDINGDGEIKPEDVICLLNYLFRYGPPPVPLQAGDCNCDGVVSPPDVICLLNYLFRNGPPPSC